MWSPEQNLGLGLGGLPSVRIDADYEVARQNQQPTQQCFISALANSGLPSMHSAYDINTSWTMASYSIAPASYLNTWAGFSASIPTTSYALSPTCSTYSMASYPSPAMSICALSDHDAQSTASPYIKVEHPWSEVTRPTTATSSCQQSPLIDLQELAEDAQKAEEQQADGYLEPSVWSGEDILERDFTPSSGIGTESTFDFGLTDNGDEYTESLKASAARVSPSRHWKKRKMTTLATARAICDHPGCGKLFSRPWNKEMYDTNQTPLAAIRCVPRMLTISCAASRHMATHDENRSKAFGCDEPMCDRRFARSHDLQRHVDSVGIDLIVCFDQTS